MEVIQVMKDRARSIRLPVAGLHHLHHLHHFHHLHLVP